MSLVPKDQMTVLRSASDSRSTAKTAQKDMQLLAVAHLINQAANTGEYQVILQTKFVDGVKEELESKGYTVRFVSNNAYDMQHHALISWKENAVTQNEPSNSGPKYNTRKKDNNQSSVPEGQGPHVSVPDPMTEEEGEW